MQRIETDRPIKWILNNILIFLGTYFSNFYVSTTDTNPTTLDPVPGRASVCAYHKDAAPFHLTTTINCTKLSCGRYLVIQMKAIASLRISAVKVFPILNEGIILHYSHTNVNTIISKYIDV